jgi:ABC-type branched-subunit amino acid transport system substrate-binding protein
LGTTGDQLGLGKHLFRIYPADQASAELLGPYVFSRHKVVGIVSDQDEYAALIERTLVRMNNQSKEPRTLHFERSLPGSTDYKSLLLRLKSKKIDGLILNPISEAGLIRMITQLSSTGLKAPLYTFILPSSHTVQEALGSKLNGVVYADLPLLESLLSAEGVKTMQKFEARFGKPKSTPLVAALALESFRFFDEAIRSGMPAHEYLRNRPVKNSLIGEYHFDDDGAVQGLKFQLMEFKNGPVVLQ